jgi:hypothetical protein
VTSPVPLTIVAAALAEHSLLMIGDLAFCGCEQHMSRSEGAENFFAHQATAVVAALDADPRVAVLSTDLLGRAEHCARNEGWSHLANDLRRALPAADEQSGGAR